ncbi:MAG TPA: hypothetical protein VE153_26265, partial [Myxococcus sp.]|nr:hypothetical protein [Myxococcus sp.]
MKTARPLLVLAALVLVSGCSQSDDFFCRTPVPAGVGQQGPLPLLRVDAPASLEVFTHQPQLLGDCGEPGTVPQVPDSVTAQVFDPDNNLIPSEVALNSEGTSATVHFTPKVVGRHHLLVAFAPVGSIQQVGVYVGRPWSGGQSPVLLPVPRCAQVDRTSRGTWLCDGIALREPSGRQVKLYSGSVLPDVAVSGNVVWVVGEGRVRRFVDNGTELELTGSLLLSQTAPVRIIQSRLASEQELWVLDDQFL